MFSSPLKLGVVAWNNVIPDLSIFNLENQETLFYFILFFFAPWVKPVMCDKHLKATAAHNR